ncbi:MAG: hypothetical protein ACLGH1_11345 [Gammaproteobacteria bacterium]
MPKKKVPGAPVIARVQGKEFDIRAFLEGMRSARAAGVLIRDDGKSGIPKMDRYTRARRRAAYVRKLEQRRALMCEVPKVAHDTRE